MNSKGLHKAYVAILATIFQVANLWICQLGSMYLKVPQGIFVATHFVVLAGILFSGAYLIQYINNR